MTTGSIGSAVLIAATASVRMTVFPDAVIDANLALSRWCF